MAGSRPRFQVASRSAGKAVCAMAAYRAGADISDETYQKTHSYGQRGGVIHAEIMAPEDAPDWVHDREQLWNAVEQSELTKAGGLKVRARLAREIVVPLAHELDMQQNREMLREWIAEQFVSRGMVADFAMHEPDKDGDQRNFHAHVMLTMREITPEGFSPSKMGAAREWNNVQLINQSVNRWQHIQNRELERAGLDVRVDFSSFESRGIDKEPEQHEGPAVTAMKRRGEKTRVAAENEARHSRHMKALHEIARVDEQRDNFAEWYEKTRGDLERKQERSLSSLRADHAQEAADYAEQINAFYLPQLEPVREELDSLKAIVEGRGIVAFARRIWQGKRDRERLEALELTIAATRQRMEEARAKLEARQRAEVERVKSLQAERSAQQREGLEKARERKEADLAAKRKEAEATAQETAKKGFVLSEGLRKVKESRAKWKRQQEENRQKAHAKEQAKEKAETRARATTEKNRKSAEATARRFRLQTLRDRATDKTRHQTPDPRVMAERQQNAPRRARSLWAARKEQEAADRAAKYREQEAAREATRAQETAEKMEQQRPAFERRQEEIRRDRESIEREIERQAESRKDKGQEMDFDP